MMSCFSLHFPVGACFNKLTQHWHKCHRYCRTSISNLHPLTHLSSSFAFLTHIWLGQLICFGFSKCVCFQSTLKRGRHGFPCQSPDSANTFPVGFCKPERERRGSYCCSSLSCHVNCLFKLLLTLQTISVLKIAIYFLQCWLVLLYILAFIFSSFIHKATHHLK